MPLENITYERREFASRDAANAWIAENPCSVVKHREDAVTALSGDKVYVVVLAHEGRRDGR